MHPTGTGRLHVPIAPRRPVSAGRFAAGKRSRCLRTGYFGAARHPRLTAMITRASQASAAAAAPATANWIALQHHRRSRERRGRD
jgi:hypothetical protein